MVLNRSLDERMITLQRQGRIGFYIGSIGEEATVLGTAAAHARARLDLPLLPRARRRAPARDAARTFIDNLFGNADDAGEGPADALPRGVAAGPLRLDQLADRHADPAGRRRRVGRAPQGRRDGRAHLLRRGRHERATTSTPASTSPACSKTPVVFVCRNNGWAISVPRERQTGSETFAQKAIAYGMPGVRVDGNDLLAVHAATRRAASARGGRRGADAASSASPTASRATRPRTTRAPTGPPSSSSRGRRRIRSCACAATSSRRGVLDDAGGRAAPRGGARASCSARSRRPRRSRRSRRSRRMFEDVYAAPPPHLREQLAELEEAIAADPRVANPRHSDA